MSIVRGKRVGNRKITSCLDCGDLILMLGVNNNYKHNNLDGNTHVCRKSDSRKISHNHTWR